MTAVDDAADTHDSQEEHHDSGSTTTLGFWIYLMSDCILFAALFATFAVLRGNVADGPTGQQIFELPFVLAETFILLFSSFTYGLAMLAMGEGDRKMLFRWLGATFILGAAFLTMEVYEFHHLIKEGFGPDRSGFLSSFFTLVATHGLHVTAGMVWMIVLLIQVMLRGITGVNQTRLACLGVFWHFLDVIWIGVFTVVYLLGAI
ncbi:cytochrome bo3 quinol oxidase subunit 3 [Arboricoccus pini]|uniref:Cytochrome bo(3) ubiquinol oxidase subunit 3 n=2 Tax=Arboricoccus pini TaxID=1963835 RepID=A0A212S151_9PROT|nr:cytochrome bo3 quinol oxidase subunit 3 [Arboricoccus pini]